MYYLEAGYSKHNRLRNAMGLALAVHLILLAGISFDAMEGSDYSPQIEVTLAMRPNSLAPDDARHIAQADQVGNDEPDDKVQPISPDTDVSSQAPPAARLRPEDTSQDPITTAAAAQRTVAAAACRPSGPEWR